MTVPACASLRLAPLILPLALVAPGVLQSSDVSAQPRLARASKPCPPNKSCADGIAPTAAIVVPASGTTISGQVLVSGTASDDRAVTLVEVQVDGGPFEAASGTTAWSFALDTLSYADGCHRIAARAHDAAGNLSPASVIHAGIGNAPGSGPDVLAICEVRLDAPTLVTLGVQMLVAGDADRDARVDVRYREVGQAWRQGLPLLRVFPETLSVSVDEQFAGSVFDLAPGVAYEIEVQAIDPDAAAPVTRTVTAVTRSVPRAEPASPRVVPVSGTSALRAALSGARAGDVIVLADGTYAGPFQLTASGTPDRPIVIRGAGSAGAVLDGGNCRKCNIVEVSGSYVHLERLRIANGVRGLRFAGVGATGNVVRRVQIENVVHGMGSNTGQSNFYLCDNVLDGRLEWPWVFEHDATSHWDDRGIEVTGDGHVVCHNAVRGFGDPVVNRKRQARSWDVYGNDIADAWDGVELDEGEGNLRLFRNRFTNVMAPISMQPVFGGPAYALRNVMLNVADEAIKLKSLGGVEEPSGALVYHNTVVAPARALNLLSTITQHNFVIANNLFVGPDALVGGRTVDWRAGIDRGVFDFNGYYPDGEFMFGTVGAIDRLYANFAEAQASGQVETSGVLLTRTIFDGGFVGPADASLRYDPVEGSLAAAAAAVDRGARLPGLNDGFTGLGPDLGALELGCPAPVYGPRPEGSESSTPPIDCGR